MKSSLIFSVISMLSFVGNAAGMFMICGKDQVLLRTFESGGIRCSFCTKDHFYVKQSLSCEPCPDDHSTPRNNTFTRCRQNSLKPHARFSIARLVYGQLKQSLNFVVPDRATFDTTTQHNMDTTTKESGFTHQSSTEYGPFPLSLTKYATIFCSFLLCLSISAVFYYHCSAPVARVLQRCYGSGTEPRNYKTKKDGQRKYNNIPLSDPVRKSPIQSETLVCNFDLHSASRAEIMEYVRNVLLEYVFDKHPEAFASKRCVIAVDRATARFETLLMKHNLLCSSRDDTLSLT
ncbi:uncharacterized protein LOC100176835 [Ciona intestinalis]